MMRSSICITGATGSFGQALVRRLLHDASVDRIVVLSRDEWKQSRMAEELNDERLRYFLGDVRDVDRLTVAFAGCDAVVHAAALKRVDAIAYNPTEVKRTNIDGTENVLRAAVNAGTGRVLLISSDKAVHPTNVYGASKQMAEHLTVAANAYGYPQGTRSSVLRYGNVLGSRGSVVHTWNRQAKRGEPLTVTDATATRFWLGLDDVVWYALAVLGGMIGGEIFVPKIKAMRVVDVAQLIATEHGVDVDASLGLRPGGEKLAEQLVSDEEAGRAFDAGAMLAIRPAICTWTKLTTRGAPLTALRYTSDMAPYGRFDDEEMSRLLKEIPCEPS